jgi:hypothetical protein
MMRAKTQARWLGAGLLLGAAGCGGGEAAQPPAPPVAAWFGATVDARMEMALDDLAAEVGALTGQAHGVVRREGPTGCSAGRTDFVLRVDAGLPSGGLRVAETRCGTGHRVEVTGHGVDDLVRGVYRTLTALGLRYFHPEQTYRPRRWVWPAEPLRMDEQPVFSRRSIHVHRTHPVELSAPREAAGLDMARYQSNWLRWNRRLGATHTDGYDREYVGDLPERLGFPRGAGFTLLGAQQGAMGVLNPDDPRPERAQIEAAVDARMAATEGAATDFDVQFNESEFTEADDRLTVQRLTTLTDYLSARYPGTRLWTINHGTHGAPTPNLGVRFYDLPQFAPPALGVKVHTLMFYDLERPAPVYGNTSFAHMLAWTRAQAAVRRIIHYPEASWWLTFDVPVPLYLAPVTLEARQHDLDLLAPLSTADPTARNGVVGHHLFSSGQEWGYWLIDYCVSRMIAQRGLTHGQCLGEFTSIFVQGEAVREVLQAVERRQVTDLRDPEVLRMLVGSDDATETALRAGIDFHPLPPDPAALLEWDDARAAEFAARNLTPLRAMATDYAAWTARLEALLPMQDEAQAPWLREVIDGVAITGLRAEHALAVYDTALAARAALVRGDLAGVEAARAGVARAEAITARARDIARRRARDYRYPEALTVAGDEPGTPGALPNRTVYPYRVYSRAHRVFYWTRPDQQLAAMFARGIDPVRVDQRMLLGDEALAPRLAVQGATGITVDWGDGTTAEALAPHRYTRDGLYAWRLRATHAGGALDWRDAAARVARRVTVPRGALRITNPAGASILNGVLPGFAVGTGRDAEGEFMLLGRIDGASPRSARGSLLRRAAEGARSGPADLAVDLQGVGALTVEGATLTLREGEGPTRRVLGIEGRLATERVIELLVSVGGFDTQGARRIVASVLGFTPNTLPERVSFSMEGLGREE